MNGWQGWTRLTITCGNWFIEDTSKIAAKGGGDEAQHNRARAGQMAAPPMAGARDEGILAGELKTNN